ncbi:MAG: helix-turn-helix transcriptional regulator [Bacilli bacterium]|nr:helix-turn-helix transcriptional regulator [Bacillales bacterium]MDY2574715.1 helix-turn-helix transcriptional regulator [Bacilli bacterium]
MAQQDISIILSNLRKNNGLTQTELGEKLGVSNKTISKWEQGTFLPDITYLLSIARIYNITVDELLSGKIENSNVYNKQKGKFLSKKKIIIRLSIIRALVSEVTTLIIYLGEFSYNVGLYFLHLFLLVSSFSILLIILFNLIHEINIL